MWTRVGVAVAALALTSCVERTQTRVDTDVRGDLEALRGTRVFFGHQSVGGNILEGVAEVARQSGVAAPALADTLIGRNGEPESKCQAFTAELDQRHEQVDVALMKFCYIDFDEQSNVEALVQRYVSTIEELERRYPRITFVRVTAPLKTSTTGLKWYLKRMLGKADSSRAVNLKRSRFNELLRRASAGKPLFDLAAAEARGPGGGLNTFTLDGQAGFSLAPEYTTDGGHLNEQGRQMAARELIRTLAGVVHARQINPALQAASGHGKVTR